MGYPRSIKAKLYHTPAKMNRVTYLQEENKLRKTAPDLIVRSLRKPNLTFCLREQIPY